MSASSIWPSLRVDRAVRIKCRGISGGRAEGEVLFSSEPISFFGGVDPDAGVIIEQTHPLYGESIAGKILVFPTGKGSTVGSYVIFQLKLNGKAPKGIICLEADPVVAVGAIVSRIPMVDRPEKFHFRDGQRVVIDADEEYIEVID